MREISTQNYILLKGYLWASISHGSGSLNRRARATKLRSNFVQLVSITWQKMNQYPFQIPTNIMWSFSNHRRKPPIGIPGMHCLRFARQCLLVSSYPSQTPTNIIWSFSNGSISTSSTILKPPASKISFCSLKTSFGFLATSILLAFIAIIP